MVDLVHELVFDAAARDPRAPALRYAGAGIGYGTLATMVESAGAGFGALGLQPRERVALWLPKREEAVAAVLAAGAVGCGAAVIDAACGPARAASMLCASGARLVVTTGERLLSLEPWLAPAKALRAALVCNDPCPDIPGLHVMRWQRLLRAGSGLPRRRALPGDEAVLLYGCASAVPVVLTHAAAVATAASMAAALHLAPEDRVLAALPLHRREGLAQVLAACARGACSVLLNPLHTRDIVSTAANEAVTALAMPAQGWLELARLDMRSCATLRRVACVDAAMPQQAADALARLPRLRQLAAASEFAQ